MPENEKDHVLAEIKTRVDGEVLRFMRDNSKDIVAQGKAALHLDIPQVPLFDNYLGELETGLTEELKDKGILNGTAKHIVDGYRIIFYYSSLPNLMENQDY